MSHDNHLHHIPPEDRTLTLADIDRAVDVLNQQNHFHEFAIPPQPHTFVKSDVKLCCIQLPLTNEQKQEAFAAKRRKWVNDHPELPYDKVEKND